MLHLFKIVFILTLTPVYGQDNEEVYSIYFNQKELDFRSLKGRKTKLEGATTYILNPAKAEWKVLMKHFKEYDRYHEIAKGSD